MCFSLSGDTSGSFSIGVVRVFGWPTVCAVKGRFSHLVPNEIASHLGIPQSEWWPERAGPGSCMAPKPKRWTRWPANK
jgi:hypothetical protein